jgi:hypothetical protein
VSTEVTANCVFGVPVYCLGATNTLLSREGKTTEVGQSLRSSRLYAVGIVNTLTIFIENIALHVNTCIV